MKLVSFHMSVAAVMAAALSGISSCTHRGTVQTFANDQSGHRQVRISFRGQRNVFRIRVNSGPVEKLRDEAFTNVMTGFQFQYGDIVIWEAHRDDRGKELTWPRGISSWWINYLTMVQASFYCINSDDISDFFSTPIYHWKASADKPRPLKGATFYADGSLVGQGSAGFGTLLDAVQVQKKKTATFILAPRIKNEGQNSPWLAIEQLEAWEQEAGLGGRLDKMGWPGEIDDFARLMDEP